MSGVGRTTRAVLCVLLAGSLLALLVACGDKDKSSGNVAPDSSSNADYEPVTVKSCGESTTYETPPERAVANDVNTTEMMLALGLEDRMAGIAGVEGREDILPKYREAYDGLDVISEEYLPNREVVLGAEADFVLAGWSYGFSEETGVTPKSLKELGIDSYAIRESCIRLGPRSPISISDTYKDLLNIGRIFGVENRAQTLVEDYERRMEEVESRIPSGASAEPPRVFVYDSGEQAPFTAGGEATPNAIIRQAGGENIFEDVENSWTSVGWEEVVERDPEFIVIVDYGSPSAQSKIEYLKNNPALEDVEAIREERFVVLPYAAATPGVRNVDAVEKLAEALYPEAF